ATLSSGDASLTAETVPPADSAPPTPAAPATGAPNSAPPISLPTLPASNVLTAGLGVPVSPVVPPAPVDVVAQTPMSAHTGTMLKSTTVHHPIAHHTVAHHDVHHGHHGLHGKTHFVTGLH